MAKHRATRSSSSARSSRNISLASPCMDLPGATDLSRNLIRIWVAKYEAGALDDDRRPPNPGGVRGAHRRPGAAGRAADARERLSKGGFAAGNPIAEKRDYVRDCRSAGLSVQKDAD